MTVTPTGAPDREAVQSALTQMLAWADRVQTGSAGVDYLNGDDGTNEDGWQRLDELREIARRSLAPTSNPVRDGVELREAYARIIDPEAFSEVTASLEKQMDRDGLRHLWAERRDFAYTKADAILALKATPVIGLSQGEGRCGQIGCTIMVPHSHDEREPWRITLGSAALSGLSLPGRGAEAPAMPDVADEYMSVSIDRAGNVQSHNAYDATFDEMVEATRKIIAALQGRLDNRLKCPFASGKELRAPALSTVQDGSVREEGWQDIATRNAVLEEAAKVAEARRKYFVVGPDVRQDVTFAATEAGAAMRALKSPVGTRP